MRHTGYTAIQIAMQTGRPLKYADPTEKELTIAEAKEIMKEDPSLIWIDDEATSMTETPDLVAMWREVTRNGERVDQHGSEPWKTGRVYMADYGTAFVLDASHLWYIDSGSQFRIPRTPDLDARFAALAGALDVEGRLKDSDEERYRRAAAVLGRKGGAAGRGASKRRDVDYSALGRKGGRPGPSLAAQAAVVWTALAVRTPAKMTLGPRLAAHMLDGESHIGLTPDSAARLVRERAGKRTSAWITRDASGGGDRVLGARGAK